MVEKLDYKKAYKDYYVPKTKPSIVNVPEMTFIAVDGQGDPNTAQSYQAAMEVLYGLSFSIKMSKMSGTQPVGYFEYVVPPLEGLWWLEDDSTFDGIHVTDKGKFCWTAMIRQPEFVTPAVFETAKAVLQKKKPDLDLSLARLLCFAEGLCVQVMHIGPYDDEPVFIQAMDRYIAENGYENDFSSGRKHHEVYLSDPRRTAPEKMRTVLRHPVVKKQ